MTRALSVPGGLEDIRSNTLYNQIAGELEQKNMTLENWSRLCRMIEDGVADGDLTDPQARELLELVRSLEGDQEQILSDALATDSRLSDADRALAVEHHNFRTKNECAHVCGWLVHDSRVRRIKCMSPNPSMCAVQHCPAK